MSEKRPEARVHENSLKSGFTWRSFLALIYIMAIFQPPIIWLYLTTGQAGLVTAIQWAVLILFVELARLSGNPLSKQEAVIIFLSSWIATRFQWFLYGGRLDHPGLVYQIYFLHSPQASIFGIADKIPSFFSPHDPVIWIQRTFMHPEWIPIFGIMAITLACYYAGDIALTLIGRQIYIETEKLPFPMAIPSAEAVTTIVDRESDRLSVFSICTVVALIYGIILYTLPMVSSASGIAIRTIPIPWIELSSFIHNVLPGASLGIATSILILASGFIIPFKVCVGIFLGSFAFYFIGNYFLVKYGITVFGAEWVFGMSTSLALQRSTLYAWASPLIGIGIAAGLTPLIRHPRILINTFKAFGGEGGKARFYTPLWRIVALYLVSSGSLTLLDCILAPDFNPIFFVLINMAWPVVYMLIVGRAEGTAATAFSIPYFKELVYKVGGYTGYNAWFVPIYSFASFLMDLKVCDLTDTHPFSYIKAWVVTTPIAMAFGLFYISELWKMAPMPSAMYPGIQIYWPISATFNAVFISPEAQFFQPLLVILGFVVGTVLYLGLDILGHASFAIGIVIGTSSAIPSAITTLMGSVIAKVLASRMGHQWWNKYRATIIAGLFLGEGLAIGFAAALTLIIKMLWVLPF